MIKGINYIVHVQTACPALLQFPRWFLTKKILWVFYELDASNDEKRTIKLRERHLPELLV